MKRSPKTLSKREKARIRGVRNPNRPVANYRVAAPTNSIEQPHQTKIPTQPQGKGS